jgi:hypothetical protein
MHFCNFCYADNATLRCAGCKGVHYCSKSCQTQDWKDGNCHKLWCKSAVKFGCAGVDWEVRPIEGKGMGLVTLRPFEADERILVERLFSEEEIHAPEFRLRDKVMRLVPEDGSLQDKYRLNAIGSHDERGDFAGVALWMSRANHACLPSALPYYDPETRCIVLHATRKLERYEEITISYTDFIDPTMTGPKTTHAVHASILEGHYGILCPPKCACKDSALLGQIRLCNELEEAFTDAIQSCTTAEQAEAVILHQGMTWVKAHNAMPLRIRFRARFFFHHICLQAGITVENLKLRTLAGQLTRPDAADACKLVD